MPAQIILGYMDEEVAPPLDAALREAIDAGRPIFVVERAPEVGKTLFERQVSDYALPAGGVAIVRQHILSGWDLQRPETTVLGGKLDSKELARIEDQRRRQLDMGIPSPMTIRLLGDPKVEDSVVHTASLDSLDTAPAERTHPPLPSDLFAEKLWDQLDEEHFARKLADEAVPGGSKTDLKHPTIHIYQLQQAGTGLSEVDYQDPVILVRAPEMGKQPNATRAYLEAITTAAATSGIARDGVDIGVLGAGGATSPDKGPGSISPVTSSLYVGYEFDEVLKQNVPVVKMIDPESGKGELELLRGKDPGVKPEEFLLNTPGLVEHIDSVLRRENVDRSKMSMTVSYFAGKTTKDVAGALGLEAGVNMEDYHTLVAINKLKREGRLGSAYVERIDCDPCHVLPQVKDEVERIKGNSVGRKYYEEAIKWGLNGAPIGGIPEEGNWAWTNDEKGAFAINPTLLTDEATKGQFYQYQRGKVLDPFFAEIATDFLDSLAAGKAFGPGDLVGKDAAVVASMGALAKKLKSGRVPPEQQSELVHDLVTQLSSLENFGNGHEQSMKVWARPGKLGDPTKKTAQLAKIGLTDADVDRALYKMANRKALEDHAPDFLRTYCLERDRQREDRERLTGVTLDL